MFQPGHTFGETDLDLILADPDDCDLGETVAVLAYARHGGPVGKCIRALAQLPTSSPCYAMDIMRLCAVPYDSDKLTLLRHYASELKDEPGIDSSPGLLVEMAYAMSFAPDLAPELVLTMAVLCSCNVSFAVQAAAGGIHLHPAHCMRAIPLLHPTASQLEHWVLPQLPRVVDHLDDDELHGDAALLLRECASLSAEVANRLAQDHMGELVRHGRSSVEVARVLMDLSTDFPLRVLRCGGLVAISAHGFDVPACMLDLAGSEVHSRHELLLHMRTKRRLPSRWARHLREGLRDDDPLVRGVFAKWFARTRLYCPAPPLLPRVAELSVQYAGTLALQPNDGTAPQEVLLAPFARHCTFIRANAKHGDDAVPVGMGKDMLHQLIALVYEGRMPARPEDSLVLAALLNMWGAERLVHRCLDDALLELCFWDVHDAVADWPDVERVLAHHFRRRVVGLAPDDRFPGLVEHYFPDGIEA